MHFVKLIHDANKFSVSCKNAAFNATKNLSYFVESTKLFVNIIR